MGFNALVFNRPIGGFGSGGGSDRGKDCGLGGGEGGDENVGVGVFGGVGEEGGDGAPNLSQSCLCCVFVSLDMGCFSFVSYFQKKNIPDDKCLSRIFHIPQ